MTYPQMDFLPLLTSSAKGVTKIREVILQFAMTGKLVPQERGDQPVSELLKVVFAERATCPQKKVEMKPCLEGSALEPPFSIPSSWAWAQIRDICRDWGQKTPDKPFSYIDVSAVDNVLGKIRSSTTMNPDDAPSRARKIVKKGTVIYSTVRPYLLNVAIVENEIEPEPIASTAFAIVHPLGNISSRFLFWYFRSPAFTSYVESVQTGIAYPAINDRQFFSGLVPIPPLAEQLRIVAKVDELMALCDQLEKQQENAESAHKKLVIVLLEALCKSSDSNECVSNWKLIEQHFDVLFTTEHSVDLLKQTLLQLAVKGKLVQQDLDEEPAIDLLHRIQEERESRIRKGLCKSRSTSVAIPKEEIPFSLPKNWNWARLGDVAELITDGTHYTPTYQSSGVPFLSVKDISSGFVDFSDTRFISEKDHQKLVERCRPEKGDLLLTKIGSNTGIAVLIDTDVEFSIFVSVALIKLPNVLDGRYFELMLNSPLVRRQSGSGTEGTGHLNLVLRKIISFLVPLPPLKEQHRIVAKVEELMQLCDALKSTISSARLKQDEVSCAVREQVLAEKMQATSRDIESVLVQA